MQRFEKKNGSANNTEIAVLCGKVKSWNISQIIIETQLLQLTKFDFQRPVVTATAKIDHSPPWGRESYVTELDQSYHVPCSC